MHYIERLPKSPAQVITKPSTLLTQHHFRHESVNILSQIVCKFNEWLFWEYDGNDEDFKYLRNYDIPLRLQNNELERLFEQYS